MGDEKEFHLIFWGYYLMGFIFFRLARVDSLQYWRGCSSIMAIHFNKNKNKTVRVIK
jgi:hypothetical protein